VRVPGAREATPGLEGVGSRGRAGVASPGAEAAQGCARRGNRGTRREEKGEGEGKRERERGGELTSGSKSGDHRLQNLGHHRGEREVGERGGCCAGELNEGKRPGEGARMGRARALGARGSSWAGLGRTAGQNRRHTHPQIGIQFTKQNPKRN
jgi:hypothetical protein